MANLFKKKKQITAESAPESAKRLEDYEQSQPLQMASAARADD